jgi:hypothetical protein
MYCLIVSPGLRSDESTIRHNDSRFTSTWKVRWDIESGIVEVGLRWDRSKDEVRFDGNTSTYNRIAGNVFFVVRENDNVNVVQLEAPAELDSAESLVGFVQKELNQRKVESESEAGPRSRE